MKTAQECTSLNDIRQGIDYYDREIFHALQKRLRYVKAAAQFKGNEQEIPAPERVAAMLTERRQWAHAAGFDSAFIEQLYSLIINWNIQQQIQHWRETHR
ncbi:isochorismate lyase [Pseudomonas sp. 5P_3.1_Bac2]|nr:isochorismate lyase [Pseudomonas sp. 5P_3.1_Bac2]